MTVNGSTPGEPLPSSPPVPALSTEPASSGPKPLPVAVSEGLAAPLPGARMALILLLLINVFNYIDRYVLAANVKPIQDQLLPHDDPRLKEKMGYLAMAFMLSYMLIAPLFGYLAERISRWKLVGIGVILWSLASGASGLAGTFHSAAPASQIQLIVGSFTFLLITRCFVGVGEAAYGPIAPTVISDLYPVRIRGSRLAWFYAAIPVGSALGYAIGGVVGKWFGWSAAFYAVTFPGILLGVWCFFMPEPPVGQADPGASVRKLHLRDYLVLLRCPSYVLNTLGMAALTFALGGIAYWMPDYIEGYRHAGGQAEVGLWFGGITAIAGLIATLLGGMAGDTLRPRFAGSYFLVSGIAMLLAFPLLLGVLYAPDKPFLWAWILIFLTCFCLFFNTGPTNTILANVTHPALRAQAFAINILIIHLLGDAISPTVIGWIADRTGPPGHPNMNAGFLAVSGTILLGAVIWLVAVPFLARDTEKAARQLDG